MLHYVYPTSVREGLFVGMMSEDQHLVSLTYFKNSVAATVWSNSGLWFISARGPFSMFTMWTMNTCCIISKVYPTSVREGLFTGVMSEHQYLGS